MGWTEERVELLKKLWLEGFSASQIAGELGDGVTRNAVIGKVHRLKLSGRAKPASAAAPRPRPTAAPRTSAPRRVSAPAASVRTTLGNAIKERRMVSAPMIGATALKISEEMEIEAYVAPQTSELFIPVDQRLSLLELSESTCKWPIGDPLTADFYFCGQHANDGHPYCEFHSRKAYHQIDKKKR
ncbi:MAG TPA: GcrA family cell cycle regulator [Devosiaceae bacterium]|jgi:GcrA cell cycle regulator|nr:GcrA family cell cycle regulator [Devosiaceae bacterium]